MFESIFKEISELYSCSYKSEHFKVYGEMLSILPISIYTLDLIHNEIPINITYEFGNHNIAEIKFEFNSINQITEFHLHTKSNFLRLFDYKKKIWKIKCESKSMINKIKSILRLVEYTKMAQKAAFEPLINGIYSNGKYYVNTKFYLGFDNKENSIIPTIEFHKNLIDFLTNKY